jgi:hypothetical protein
MEEVTPFYNLLLITFADRRTPPLINNYMNTNNGVEGGTKLG